MSEVVVTSEAPVVEDAPAPAKSVDTPKPEEAKPEETTAEAPKVDESEDSTEGEQETKETPKKPNKLQERFSKLTSDRDAARQEAEYWRRVALEAQQPKEQPAQTTPTADAEPQLDQFQTELDYAKAHAKWVARQEAKAIIEMERAQRQAAEQQAKAQELVQTYQARIEEARTRYADYEEVMVTAPEVPLPAHLSQALLESDFGPDVAYRLAKDPQKVQRLVTLSPTAALREIGRIEAEIEAGRKTKAIPSVSNAPEPIRPVDAKTSTPSRDSEPGPDRPYAEWLAWRNRQAKRGR